MITNQDITIYHKILNETTRLEEYRGYYYKNCWVFGGKGASINKGYEKANDIEIRIPYLANEDLNKADFTIGDIIYIGKGRNYVKTQSELNGDVYNITSITNNTFR